MKDTGETIKMNGIDKLKFIAENDIEYIVLKSKFIENKLYGYAVNINDEMDSMFVEIINDNDNIYFEIVNDKNLINKILK